MIVRGVIRYFDPATYKAAVELGGSIATVVEAMPVATHIRKEHVVAGRKCGVVLFDPNNPSDACVAFIYGAVNPGHITIDQGYEFRPGGDANSAFGEDGSGNAYFKDAVAGTKTLRSLQYAQVVFRATDVAITFTNPGTAYAEAGNLARLRQTVPFDFITPKEVRIQVSFYINEATTYGFEVYNFTDAAQVCEVTGDVASGFCDVQGSWTACALAAAKQLGIRVKGGTATVDFELYPAIMEIR